MPRRAYPSPGHSAMGPAFLPGKTPRFIEAPTVAKILRRVLRRCFPGQKFYVRTERYSGGSSIMECHYCGERAVGAVSEWVEFEGDFSAAGSLAARSAWGFEGERSSSTMTGGGLENLLGRRLSSFKRGASGEEEATKEQCSESRSTR